MPKFFTHQWKKEDLAYRSAGGLLWAAGSSQFKSRGVLPGDILFILYESDGGICVLGKMQVKRIWDRRHPGVPTDLANVWPDAQEVAEAESGTPFTLERSVPMRLIEETAEFIGKDGPHRLAQKNFLNGGFRENHHPFQGVHRIGPLFARHLNSIIAHPLESR